MSKKTTGLLLVFVVGFLASYLLGQTAQTIWGRSQIEFWLAGLVLVFIIAGIGTLVQKLIQNKKKTNT